MARPAFLILKDQIAPPRILKAPRITGIGIVPPEYGQESHSTPYISGDLTLVQTYFWKRIHFCNVNCGAPCKVSWSYKRGISTAEVNEISSKIGANLQAAGISSEIGSKISSTVTLSREEQAAREFTRTAPNDGGVTHAHWQLMERYTFAWTVKRWFRKPKTWMEVVEGSTDVFDETLLFYIRPDCSASKDQESFLDKLKRGLEPLIAQGTRAGVLVPAKANDDGTFSLEGVPGKYEAEDRIPNNLIKRYLRLGQAEAEILNEPLYLQHYAAPLESLIGTVKKAQPARYDNPLLSFGIGAAVGAVVGMIFAPRSGKDLRERYLRSSQDVYRELNQWVDLGKERLREAKEGFRETIKERREASGEQSAGKTIERE